MSNINFSNLTAFKEAVIKVQPDPTKTNQSVSYMTDYTDAKLQEMHRTAQRAYSTDGIIRNAVDRFSDSQAGFRINGTNPRIVEYVNRRLNQITLSSGTPWQLTFTQAWHEQWRTGTSGLLKVRGNPTGALRALYDNKLYAVNRLYVIGMGDYEPRVSDSGAPFWRPTSRAIKFKLTEGKAYDKAKAYISMEKSETESDLTPGLDMIVFAYKKPPESSYGIGVSFTALNDVKQLRNLEAATIIMISKNLHPLIHHQIEGPGYGNSINTEIQKAEQKWRQYPPDGVLVTPSTHKIDIHGGESQALRVGDYLKFLSTRCISSMSASPFELGFEKGNIGDAEAAARLRKTKIDTARAEFSMLIENYLLWELAYEGGFDPYNNDDHKVWLEFIEVDETLIRANENHMADLFTKNVLELEETRPYLRAAKKPAMDINRSFAGMAAELEPVPPVKPSTKSELYDRNLLKELVPANDSLISDSLVVLGTYFDVDFSDCEAELTEVLKGFSNDRVARQEAFIEFTASKLNSLL